MLGHGHADAHERTGRHRPGPWSYVLLMLVSSLLSIGFSHLLSVRLAGTARTDVRAVLSGLSALGLLAFGLQLALVAWFGSHRNPTHASKQFVARFAVASVAIGALAGGVAALFVDADGGYRATLGVQVGVSTAAMLVAVVPRAELLDAERWVALGALAVIDPLIRLAAGAVVLEAGRPRAGVVPIVFAQIVTAMASFLFRDRRSTDPAHQPSFGYVSRGVLASTGLLLTVVFGWVAVRSNLGAQADVLNEAAAVSRSVLFLPLLFSVPFFPAMARNPLGSPALRRAYVSALVWTTLTTASAVVAIAVAPRPISRLLVAEVSAVDAGVVRVLAVAACLLAVSTVSIFLYIAHGSRLSLVVWGAAAIAAVGQLVARDAMELAIATFVSSSALLVAVSIPALLRVQPILHSDMSRPTTHGIARTDLAVVVPSFNPGPAVVDTLTELHDFLASIGVDGTIIVVSDGSTDESCDLIDRMTLPNLVHLRHAANQGKGAAVRTGFSHANSTYVGFIDADGDLSPRLFGTMLAAQAETGADIVFGSKLHPDSTIEATTLRRTYSSMYRKMIRVLFRLDVHDTQTGVKLFRRDVIDAVLPNLRECQFALDLELFIAARAAGFVHFVEVPVDLRRANGSTITLRSIRRMIGDTLRLFWRARVSLEYDRSASQLKPGGTGVLRQAPGLT